MDILEKLLEIYIKTHEKCDGNFFKVSSKLPNLEIGDVFSMYGESIVYGLVISVDEEAGIYEFIDLVTSPILGDFSTSIQVDSLFAKTLYVTPLVYNLFRDQLVYCEKISHLDENKLRNVLETYDKLRFYEFKGVRNRFLSYETERLEVIEVMYLSRIFEEIENEENVIYVNPSKISEIVKRHSEEISREELAVAASYHLRKDNYILIIENGKIKIIFDDSIVGKEGKVLFFNEELSSGKIPAYLEFEVLEQEISLPILEKYLNIILE